MLLSQTKILDEVSERELQTRVWECQALGGNPSLWLFGRIPNSHVGSCRTVFESVCLWIHCQSSVWSTWASKFNVNFNSKGFLLSPGLLTSTFEYDLYLSFDRFKRFYFLVSTSIFSIKICNFISFLLCKISLSVRNIIHHFSDT